MIIYILLIENSDRTDLTAHYTRNHALDHLHSYVKNNWDDGLNEQYGAIETLTRAEAIDAYFDAMSFALDYEYYSLVDYAPAPAGITPWTWHNLFDRIDYHSLTEVITEQIVQGSASATQLVKLYDQSTPIERDAIDNTLDALTDWTLPDLLEQSQ